MLNLSKSRRQAIAKAVSALEAYRIKAEFLERLVDVLDGLSDRELYRANPRMLATHLQLLEREVLRVLVFGVKEGIFTMNWEIQCPVCNSIDFAPKHLYDLRTLHTCPVCRTIHANDADAQMRVTFSVDERLRKLGTEADDAEFRDRMDRRYGIVSGHRLLTLQAFREAFPRETLPPSESLVIRRVAILFTDLTGSTALYARRGDARAFDLVRQHFALLFNLIDTHNGVVIKTIGDAVMGAFTEPLDAVQAAIAMHQQLDIFNQTLHLPQEDYLALKIGIEVGPCISVTLNDRSDYFGTTVNTAARIQATATGNSFALTLNCLQDAAAQSILQTADYPTHSREVMLKGLDAPVQIHYFFPLQSPTQQ